jgi:hypothetical protein
LKTVFRDMITCYKKRRGKKLKEKNLRKCNKSKL